jgi:hypothetical protein
MNTQFISINKGKEEKKIVQINEPKNISSILIQDD